MDNGTTNANGTVEHLKYLIEQINQDNVFDKGKLYNFDISTFIYFLAPYIKQLDDLKKSTNTINDGFSIIDNSNFEPVI